MRIVKALPGVYESIIVACKEMDLFELPGAIGEFERDRFVFANDSFLGVTGLNRSDISGVALSAVVKFHFGPADAKPGKPVPIAVRWFDRNLSIGGLAALSRDNLVYLMIPFGIDPSADFELGRTVGFETERKRVAKFLHEGQLQTL